MNTQTPGLMQAIAAKMNFLSAKQAVLAQNIANANTPGYAAQDLRDQNFNELLKSSLQNKSNISTVTPSRTNASHIATDSASAGSTHKVKVIESKVTFDITPDGNSVDIEEQMLKAARVSQEYALMTSLYQKNGHLIKIALGKGR